jgi:hypothetical protein
VTNNQNIQGIPKTKHPKDPMKKWANELNRVFSKEEVQIAKKKKKKKYSPSLAIKEMQIKTTLRFHLTPVRTAMIKNTNDNRCQQGCGEKGNFTLLVEM